MVHFGYSLTKSSVFDYNSQSSELSKYIAENEPTSRLCISCGACSATCTGGALKKLELHSVHIYIKRNMNDKILSQLQNCMYCGKCQLVCPRGVNNRNVIRLILSSLAVV